MPDITLLLNDARSGDSRAEEALLCRIYTELHSLGRVEVFEGSPLATFAFQRNGKRTRVFRSKLRRPKCGGFLIPPTASNPPTPLDIGI